MKAVEIQVGHTYMCKVSGDVVPVRIIRERAGWDAINTRTSREVHIRTAARLRCPCAPALATAPNVLTIQGHERESGLPDIEVK